MLDESLLDAPEALAGADRYGLLRGVAESGARVRTAARNAAESGIADLLSLIHISPTSSAPSAAAPARSPSSGPPASRHGPAPCAGPCPAGRDRSTCC